MNLATSTLEAIQQDIDRYSMKLATKPVTENFGQKEVNSLLAKYSDVIADQWSDEARAARNLIVSFENFCKSFVQVTA